MQLFGRAGDVFGHHHQAPAPQQRAEDLPHRHIERIRVALRPDPGRRQARVQRPQQLRHVAVRDRNTFGHTRGTRRVDDIGDTVGRGHRQRGGGPVLDTGIVDVDHRHAVALEPAGQLRGAQRRNGFGVGEHEPDPSLRRGRVDRQIGRPGLEHRQNRRNRLGGPRKQQRHRLSRARAQAGQQMRQPVRRLIQLPVRQRTAFAHQRHVLRRPGHLCREELRHRHRRARRPGQDRRVAERFQLRVLGVAQHIQRRQQPGRVGGHGRQDALQSLRQVRRVEVRQRLPGADRAQELLVTESQEEQPEVPHRAEAGVRRGGRHVGQAEGETRRDEVDDDPVRRLPRPAEVAFPVQRAGGELLMPQRFSRALIDMPTEVGERGGRRGVQHQRHHPGQHAGMRLRLGIDPPADREVEHHLVGAVGAPSAHQQRTGGGEHR
ncbi:hypothetical protein PICSAR132_02400 [Mycobacterium avium subsp. paratuberculosis]|nr:hypothetical protein PICSAR103_00198 [Mycobacterium avium subsp. paratuberculosis]CAG6852961.1 hypothetical protein PICSAR100_00200 [Mycobacterium avium subsp. paratuberculosis]CAG6853174.1 hypothetical protein PICSAR1_00243 [Mycobacterium avium subsp. paratuberculosis]CAG6854721.1 hypothetical protein PICSAR102_00360 [Mycobacterium avium subsp. paratuberculosis]CAG6856040.1 hypothetical protein PICSAR111_00387 [Mycobacterium avium subsp. paratuberculosis]